VHSTVVGSHLTVRPERSAEHDLVYVSGSDLTAWRKSHVLNSAAAISDRGETTHHNNKVSATSWRFWIPGPSVEPDAAGKRDPDGAIV